MVGRLRWGWAQRRRRMLWAGDDTDRKAARGRRMPRAPEDAVARRLAGCHVASRSEGRRESSVDVVGSYRIPRVFIPPRSVPVPGIIARSRDGYLQALYRVDTNVASLGTSNRSGPRPLAAWWRTIAIELRPGSDPVQLEPKPRGRARIGTST
jgi:hypothetical protein